MGRHVIVEVPWSSDKPKEPGVYRTRYNAAGKPARGWRYWDGKFWSNPYTLAGACMAAAELGRLLRINCTTSNLEYREKWKPKTSS